MAGIEIRQPAAAAAGSRATDLEPGGTDPLIIPGATELLTTGEATFHRMWRSGSRQCTTQRLYLTYFTARKTETIATLRVSTGTTAAAATPTLCRLGVYTIDGSGNVTLAHSTANDTTLFAATNTRYSKALQTAFSKVRGTRYALALLIVSGATMPSIIAGPTIGDVAEYGDEPRLAGTISSQADLPASVVVGNITNGEATRFYTAMLP